MRPLTDEKQPLWRPRDGFTPYKTPRALREAVAAYVRYCERKLRSQRDASYRRKWHTFAPPSGAHLCPPRSRPGFCFVGEIFGKQNEIRKIMLDLPPYN